MSTTTALFSRDIVGEAPVLPKYSSNTELFSRDIVGEAPVLALPTVVRLRADSAAIVTEAEFFVGEL
jgi:hypothetical protein